MTSTFKYQRKAADRKHRIVSLMNEAISEWMEFQNDVVEYPEQCVLEVEKEDGTRTIEYERAVRVVTVGCDGNMLYLAQEIPVARLWLRSAGGMAYKVPSVLMEKDGNAYMLIPGGTQNAVLFGDEYFSRAYSLSMG